MPHFGINQLFLSPLIVCDLLRNRCAICSGITVRFAPELLCDLTRILHPNKIDPKTRKGKIVRAISDLQEKGEKATVTAIARITKVEASNVSHDLKDLCVREIVQKGEKLGKEQPYELVEK